MLINQTGLKMAVGLFANHLWKSEAVQVTLFWGNF